MDYPKEFESFEHMLDYGFVTNVKRVANDGVWDETGHYAVTFWDGTKHDFYDMSDILRFANMLLRFHNREER